MILLVLFAFALVSVPLLGGRLGRLATVHVRHAWAMPAALGIQILILGVLPDGGGALHGAAHVASFLLGGAVVWMNRRLPGLWLIAGGGGLNLAAISANGGVMPASPHAVRLAGLEHAADRFHNSAIVGDARLAFLGDVFALPQSWPFANVFSVGDVLLVIGGAVALHVLSGSRPARLAAGCVARRERRSPLRALVAG